MQADRQTNREADKQTYSSQYFAVDMVGGIASEMTTSLIQLASKIPSGL